MNGSSVQDKSKPRSGAMFVECVTGGEAPARLQPPLKIPPARLAFLWYLVFGICDFIPHSQLRWLYTKYSLYT